MLVVTSALLPEAKRYYLRDPEQDEGQNLDIGNSTTPLGKLTRFGIH